MTTSTLVRPWNPAKRFLYLHFPGRSRGRAGTLPAAWRAWEHPSRFSPSSEATQTGARCTRNWDSGGSVEGGPACSRGSDPLPGNGLHLPQCRGSVLSHRSARPRAGCSCSSSGRLYRCRQARGPGPHSEDPGTPHLNRSIPAEGTAQGYGGRGGFFSGRVSLLRAVRAPPGILCRARRRERSIDGAPHGGDRRPAGPERSGRLYQRLSGAGFR